MSSDEFEEGAVHRRSKILMTLGVVCIGGGIYALFIPQAPDASLGQHRLYTGVASVFWFAVGVGLLRHQRWAVWLYGGGVLLALGAILLAPLETGQTFGSRAVVTLVIAVMLAIPAVLMWLRRDSLRPIRSGGDNA